MRIEQKPSTMVFPAPAIMATCGDNNIITIAWTGTINSVPPMTYISVRKERHSHQLLMDNMEFVINLTTEDLAYETDYCGIHSGRDMNKFESLNLTPIKSKYVKCPSIKESPVSLECQVTQVIELGSHDMFMAEIVGITVDDQYMDDAGRFDLNRSKLICYSAGKYFSLNEFIGHYGHSKKWYHLGGIIFFEKRQTFSNNSDYYTYSHNAIINSMHV